MSSPRKVRGKTGRDNDEEEGNSGNLNLRNSLPSSSQKMTPTKPVQNKNLMKYEEHLDILMVFLLIKTIWYNVFKLWKGKLIFGNKMNSENVKPSHHLSFSDKYELVYPEPLESDTDETVWDVSDRSLRNRWNSMDSETAGPSKTVSPVLSGSSRLSKDTETSVSEKELTQLAQIRPLIFNSSARSAMRDCLNTLQKKEELDIIREFLELEQMTLPDDFNSGNTLQNRDKNRYRDILPSEHATVLPLHLPVRSLCGILQTG
ncbi:tyrosine-protein phosphatase non-receptor type 20 isoform X2 [Mus musculus]|uniref:tyrosine-protein phosphatase non-receptor type 20 isoform X2 n=1 Tax=Mus musculus TaxID=10090 RepID=UPI0005ABAF9A|nr:tyrosine-protein phosphatase non-receptor type 20 isoform X2 [Mus musculus]|eukprot:XP_011243298.1 PREDICTED: tyrosine-protein phosphatase non-receptor type 20 isoform X2 [Mus musculus]